MKSVPRATLALGLLAAAFVARAQDAQAVYVKALPSVMTVNTVARDDKKYIGTAFLAISDGLAVTAWHVVADAKSVIVRFSDGEEFESTGLVDKDEWRDLALIRVRVKGRPMLNFAEGDPAIGSKAFPLGAPKGLEFSITEGIISAVRQIDGMRQYQYSAPTNPGNSGGPVLSPEATVLGVVSYGLRESEGLNFAIPGSYARALDATLPTQPWGTQVSTRARAEEQIDAKNDAESAAQIFDLRVQANFFRGSLLDLEREATTVSPGRLKIPDSVVYAIPGLRRISDELRSLKLSDAQLSQKVAKTAADTATMAVQIETLKKAAEYAIKYEWDKDVNSIWRDVWASINTAPQIWTDESNARLLALVPSTALAKYPKDLIACYRGENPSQKASELGIVLDMRYLPRTVVGLVERDSPAWKAGLRPSDILVSVDGKAVTDWSSFGAVLAAGKGKTISIKVDRPKGSDRTFRLKL